MSGDKAEVYCNTCESPLCHSCVQQHNQSKALKKHTLVPLENAKQGPSCESCASGDKAEVYCSTCERSLCYNCIQRHNRSKVLIKHFLIPLEERRVIAKCELCSARPPEGHCLDCNNHLCSPCIESHRRMKIFQSHIVVSKVSAPLQCADVTVCG